MGIFGRKSIPKPAVVATPDPYESPFEVTTGRLSQFATEEEEKEEEDATESEALAAVSAEAVVEGTASMKADNHPRSDRAAAEASQEPRETFYDPSRGFPKQLPEPMVAVPFEQAVKRAQAGDTSLAVLASLSKKRDEMMAQLEDGVLDQLISGSSGKKKDRRNLITSEVKTSREVKRLFLQFCRDRRGSGLRAWRLDIDLKGTNRVLYDEFSQNVMHMGLSLQEAMSIWKAFRPPGKTGTALRFHEFDPAEWSNLNGFLEILWNDFNFDIDLVWNYFDKNGDGSVGAQEFANGMNKIGFKGHAQRIFYSLDSAGVGSMWKETMHYLFMLQPESHEKPEDSPLIREFQAFVKSKFGTPGKLADKMGLLTAVSSVSIHSAARRLEQMGYKGNALHTAITISKCNQFVNRTDLIEACGCKEGRGHRVSVSYAGRCMLQGAHDTDTIALTKIDEKPGWNDGTYDPCSFNRGLGKRERHGFSNPFPRPMRDEVLKQLKPKENQEDETIKVRDGKSYFGSVKSNISNNKVPRLKDLRAENEALSSARSGLQGARNASQR